MVLDHFCRSSLSAAMACSREGGSLWTSALGVPP
jgi:hypothetical protein